MPPMSSRSAPPTIADAERARAVGPVTQFALLITPIVMNCFLLVYALTGWVIEGRDKLNWSLEAGGVALWVGLGVPLYGVLSIGWTRLMGGGWRHPLVLSGLFHTALALALAMAVLVAARS